VFTRNAQAFLRVHRARIVARAQPEKNILELVHAGIGEIEGGVVLRHHRRRGHPRMAFALEKAEEFLPNLL